MIKHGYAILDVIISLLIICISMPLVYSSYKIIANNEMFPVVIQDQIALTQLRRIMNTCYDIDIQYDTLSCIYKDEVISIQTSSNNTFISDGTLIIFSGVSDIFFTVQQIRIYLNYLRNKKWEKGFISYVQ